VPSRFDAPMNYVVGLNAQSDDRLELAEFTHFYARVHVAEVLRENPGFLAGTQFELVVPDPRGDVGPRFLSSYDIADRESADRYLEKTATGAAQYGAYSPGPPVWQQNCDPVWRLAYARLTDYGTRPASVFGIFAVGIDAPDGASADELDEFDDFYSRVHIRELVDNFGFSRAIRYRLQHEIRYPAPRCPAFLAVYEAADPGVMVAARRAFDDPEANAGKWTAGPAIWQAHTTPWRLWYRRLAA
jgi:hypothetical protein